VTSSCTSHSGIVYGWWVVPLRTAVLIPVSHADGVMLPLIQDKCRRHVIRKETDFHFGCDELHGYIIVHPVNGNSGIPVHFPVNAVKETLIQPFTGLGGADGLAGAAVAFKRCAVNSGMERCVITTDVIGKEPVKLTA